MGWNGRSPEQQQRDYEPKTITYKVSGSVPHLANANAAVAFKRYEQRLSAYMGTELWEAAMTTTRTLSAQRMSDNNAAFNIILQSVTPPDGDANADNTIFDIVVNAKSSEPVKWCTAAAAFNAIALHCQGEMGTQQSAAITRYTSDEQRQRADEPMRSYATRTRTLFDDLKQVGQELTDVAKFVHLDKCLLAEWADKLNNWKTMVEYRPPAGQTAALGLAFLETASDKKTFQKNVDNA